ncbi:MULTISPECIES: DUF3892 domain-containing protein [Bacillota]|jgi:hypothetical protein|uniref:DUF3892 domain-containing protein n=2 Tax=Amedibacillus TaxID=2749846 RepID=A0A7G9GLA4_9FIRM|nr:MULTISPECIES: DUF3892 domain-containing protein [Bacillota]QNM11586.1 DUF3892 domain-containing protein [[Eubacterium] hominis]MCH4285169.1 DUF3892 domain-containing protein [Amedibacillus hominis]RGB56197.1 DUF3892 domain-containing protein [Absiella sp. AM22-9]RGB61958.1 DUF3892 domain-containing protein [Absiella sp. AM10-20]RGB70220.1 DUF3892 domain-containing protein [Absiella sp. AM09-45]
MKKEKSKKQSTKFVAARRNSDGTLSEFKDAEGNTYDYEQALEAVEQGLIENALPFTGRDGARHIRGVNDGDESTNLRNLKEF